MTEIVVNGQRYVPEGLNPTGPKIGIGVTTRNRPDVLVKTISEIQRLTPGAVVVVVDDAGDDPLVNDGSLTYFRFEENVGIARAKNKCLEILYEEGCEHIFLFDDDAYPLVEKWWEPYVESPEPHLMYVFREFAAKGAPKLNDCKVLRVENGVIAYSTPRGVMLYVERWVLDVAGGMDPGFGLWGYEHGDWSNRIHAFGLTAFRYADVPDSSALIYSLDEHVHTTNHTRSVPEADRKRSLTPNKERHDRQYNSAIRYEFREQRDVVLTAYLSGSVDAQRKREWAADEKQVEPLMRSLAGRDVVLFHNDLPYAPGRLKVEDPVSPYFDRWLHFYRYLRNHAEVRFAWCVDSTDVLLLNEPFDLRPGVLYVGSEPNVVGIEWMRKNHPEYSDWIAKNERRLLLNCGLVGGDRETVMRLCQRMVREYHDHKGAGRNLVLDMGAFNYVVYSEFTIETGPAVHTVFKANERKSQYARWAHK